MAKLYDIAVLGGSAAGLAAAARIAACGREVVVVCPPGREIACPLADWVPGDFFRIRHLPRGLAKASGAVVFKRVCYHNAALSQQAEYSRRSAAGYFVRAGDLDGALRGAAEKAGARCRTTATRPAVRLAEDHVELLGTTRTLARLLIVTHGRPADAISELAMPVHTVPQPPLVVAGLDVPCPGARGLGGGGKRQQERLGCLGGALHVVESPERSEIGMFFALRDLLHLRVLSTSKAAGNRAAELSAMVTGLQQAGLLPGALALGKARGAVWHPPAAMALELEVHVAKRCLLAGTAGGFADSISGQTPYASVRSALLAAEVAMKALESKDPQDVLSQYKTAWRKELADYLRPPSTSLQMLLPLLFANRQIVGRFSAALLFGEPI